MTDQPSGVEVQRPLIPSARPNRPSDRDEGSLRAARRVIARRLAELPNVESEIDMIERDLEAVIDGFRFDGYELARALDNEGWACDAEIVEILHGAHAEIAFATRKRTETWVAEWNVAPALAIGAKVKVKDRGELHDGEIIDIDRKQAAYTIFIESAGHVRAGIGTHGIVLPFEKVEAQQ